MRFVCCILQFLACTLILCAPNSALKTPDLESAIPKTPFIPSFKIPEVAQDYYVSCREMMKTQNPDSILLIDFIKFRYSYLIYSEKTGAYVPLELEKDFRTSANTGNLKKAEESADKILGIDFTDIDAHMMKAYIQSKNGQDDKFHVLMAKRLIESITISGDGKTPQTAYHVAQVKEEYALLSLFGLRMNGQYLVMEGNHSFDILECVNKDGKVIKLYFDITEHMSGLERRLK